MPNKREKTFTETVVGFVFENKEKHQEYMSKLSAETLSAVIGRKGKLIVAGETGGEFIFKVTAYGVVEDDSLEGIRNEVWLQDDTFMDILIGELDPYVARARGQIKFTGDRSLYDSHEIMTIVQEWMKVELRPIARRIARAMGVRE